MQGFVLRVWGLGLREGVGIKVWAMAPPGRIPCISWKWPTLTKIHEPDSSFHFIFHYPNITPSKPYNPHRGATDDLEDGKYVYKVAASSMGALSAVLVQLVWYAIGWRHTLPNLIPYCHCRLCWQMRGRTFATEALASQCFSMRARAQCQSFFHISS